jgi:hypothetical protein
MSGGPEGINTAMLESMRQMDNHNVHSGASSAGGDFAIGAGLDQEFLPIGKEGISLGFEGASVDGIIAQINQAAQESGLASSITEAGAGLTARHFAEPSPGFDSTIGAQGNLQQALSQVHISPAKQVNIGAPATPIANIEIGGKGGAEH